MDVRIQYEDVSTKSATKDGNANKDISVKEMHQHSFYVDAYNIDERRIRRNL